MLVGEGLAGQDVDGEAAGASAFDALAVVVGGDDAGDLGGEGAGLDAVVKVEQRRAPAGEGDGEFRWAGLGFCWHGLILGWAIPRYCCRNAMGILGGTIAGRG